jgi:hypothetical protein
MHLAKRRKSKGQVRNENGLKRWIKEKWRNVTPLSLGDNAFYECGKKSKKQRQLHLPSVCRPTKKISNKTPRLARTFTQKQIKKAVKIKSRGDRVYWNTL